MFQVVIVPILKKEADTEAVMAAVDGLRAAAEEAGIRVKVDASTEKAPGWKFNHYEMKVCLLACGLEGNTQLIFKGMQDRTGFWKAKHSVL